MTCKQEVTTIGVDYQKHLTRYKPYSYYVTIDIRSNRMYGLRPHTVEAHRDSTKQMC